MKKIKKYKHILLGFCFVLLFFGSFFIAKRENKNRIPVGTVSKIQAQTDTEITGYQDVNHISSDSSDTKDESEQKKQKSNKKKKGNGKADSSQTAKPEKNPSNIQIKTKKDQTDPEYFVTTIIDKEIVTDETYAFSITHLQAALTVKETNVYVNDNWVLYQGSVFLTKKTNHIVVEVAYETKEQQTIWIRHAYTVYLELEDIVISCDLEDKKTYTTPYLQFSAKAELAGVQLPLQVYSNDVKLEGQEEKYETTLQAGENLIVLRCKKGNKTCEKRYHITYTIPEKKETKEKAAIQIETNLKEETVYRSKLTVHAKAMQGNTEIPLTLTNNSKIVEAESTNCYIITLTEGENTVVLSAKSGEQEITKTYKILYKVLTGTGEEKSNDNAPTLYCSLKDGDSVKNKKLNFYVNGKDKNGHWLDSSHFTIHCQGKDGKLIYANTDQISYQITLTEGYNIILIALTDEEGNQAKKAYSIQYKPDENGIVGTATISVEATTIGCGNLIPPTKVDIIEDKPMSYMLCELLEKNGFSYESSGTATSNFYLARITKTENFLHPHIPSDLEEKLMDVDENYPGDFYNDSLGEFDFSTGSGWMYQVNGVYPNYSFSDCFLQDGDVVRIRFTLYYGCDIGGGMVQDNADNGEQKSNWSKEW